MRYAKVQKVFKTAMKKSTFLRKKIPKRAFLDVTSTPTNAKTADVPWHRPFNQRFTITFI